MVAQGLSMRCLDSQVLLNMTLLSIKRQCSALGPVIAWPILNAPLDQNTSSLPTSPDRAETALLHFRSTAVQGTQERSRPPDQANTPQSIQENQSSTLLLLILCLGGAKKATITREHQTPGPAAYKVVDPCVYRQKPPQYSMTGRNFTPDETTKTPGPGAHYPEQVTFTKRKAPSFSFGLRHSDYISPLIVQVTE